MKCKIIHLKCLGEIMQISPVYVNTFDPLLSASLLSVYLFVADTLDLTVSYPEQYLSVCLFFRLSVRLSGTYLTISSICTCVSYFSPTRFLKITSALVNLTPCTIKPLYACTIC